MKPGDLVALVMPSRYRGPVRRGILVKRTHLTYDPGYCRWDVIYKGKIENVRQSNLRPV